MILDGGIQKVHDPDKSNVEATVPFRYKDGFQRVGSIGDNLEINVHFMFFLFV